MKCEEIRERMPDVAAGFSKITSGESDHLANCSACLEQLKAMRATMNVLDEGQVPEPSPYFDVRLQARLREEIAKPQAGWLQWFRRPVLAPSQISLKPCVSKPLVRAAVVLSFRIIVRGESL